MFGPGGTRSSPRVTSATTSPPIDGQRDGAADQLAATHPVALLHARRRKIARVALVRPQVEERLGVVEVLEAVRSEVLALVLGVRAPPAPAALTST